MRTAFFGLDNTSNWLLKPTSHPPHIFSQVFILKASRVAVLQAPEGGIAHAAKLALKFFFAARTWVGWSRF
jgi:hypothetical protein